MRQGTSLACIRDSWVEKPGHWRKLVGAQSPTAVLVEDVAAELFAEQRVLVVRGGLAEMVDRHAAVEARWVRLWTAGELTVQTEGRALLGHVAGCKHRQEEALAVHCSNMMRWVQPTAKPDRVPEVQNW